MYVFAHVCSNFDCCSSGAIDLFVNVHKNSRLTWQWIPGICLSLSPQEEDSKAVPPCPPLLNMDSRIRFRSPCMLLY